MRTSGGIAVTFAMTISLAGAFAAREARAQDTATTATAEALFAEGRRLMMEGKPELACPKFEGAQKVAPTPGTLLNLANCYEKAGRTASAWASFREAVSMSRAAGRSDLADNAQKRAAALEPKLPRISIAVAAPPPGIEVTRDGVPIPREAWSTPVPVDPGEHVVDAKAPGRKPQHVVATAPAEGATTTVQVPELEIDPNATAPRTSDAQAAPGGQGASAGNGSPRERVAPSAPPPAGGASEHDRGTTQRALALGAGGLGVGGLVLGGVFAARAAGKNSDSKAECRPDDPNKCTQAGKDLRDDARSAGNVATVGLVAGVVFVGAGVALWFTAPKSNEPSIAIAPSLGGVTVQGSFR